MKNDTALNSTTLELTQKIQLHFPRNLDSAVLQFWNGQSKETLTAWLFETFGQIPEAPVPPILRFITEVTIPARAERFLPKKSYVVNTKPGPHVKIRVVDPDFTAGFGDKAEEPTAGTTLRRYVLARPSVFAPSMKEIQDGGFVTKTTPGQLFSLLEQQPDGPKSKAGPLLTDGWANLFEMDDKDGVARLVRAYWYDGLDGGWGVYASDASYSDQWNDEDRLFSGNSRLPSAA